MSWYGAWGDCHNDRYTTFFPCGSPVVLPFSRLSPKALFGASMVDWGGQRRLRSSYSAGFCKLSVGILARYAFGRSHA